MSPKLLRSLDAQLTCAQIDVAPFEWDHLAAAQLGFTPEQHDSI
jgi:hypothetical protein